MLMVLCKDKENESQRGQVIYLNPNHLTAELLLTNLRGLLENREFEKCVDFRIKFYQKLPPGVGSCAGEGFLNLNFGLTEWLIQF